MTNSTATKDDLSCRAEFFQLAMTMFLSNKDVPGLIPEVLSFMNADQIMTFCATFGGQRVYVPTPEELSIELYAAVSLYYQTEYDYPFSAIKAKLKLTNAQAKKVEDRLARWKDFVTRNNIDAPTLLKGTTPWTAVPDLQSS